MHKFQVGQSVDLIPSIVRRAAKGTYEIIRLIPDNEDDPQYRVKSAAEPHERVVPESQLELSYKAGVAVLVRGMRSTATTAG